MLKFIPKPYLIVVILVLLMGSFGYGYHLGIVHQIEKHEAARLALQDELFDLADVISVKNAEILALQQSHQELANELETEALEAKGSDAPGISVTGGLQRLERRWGSSN